MTCPNAPEWDLLAMDALGQREAETLLLHTQACEACREQLASARRVHIECVRMYETFDRGHDELREQLLADLPDEVPPRKRARPLAWLRDRLGDATMTLSKTTPRPLATVLLPAACVLIAVSIFLMPGKTSAFAAAIARLREADTITCRVVTTMTVKMQAPRPAGGTEAAPGGATDVEQTADVQNERLYISAGLGVRRDTLSDGTITRTKYRPLTGPTIVLHPAEQTYETWEGDAEPGVPQEMKKTMSRRQMPEINFAALPQDPDRLLTGLRALKAGADRELGSKTIDGHEVVGFEIRGEKMGYGPPFADRAKENRAEFWVDQKTGLPTRLEFHFVYNSSVAGANANLTMTIAMATVYDRFELDQALPPDWFKPTVPKGCTLRTAEPPADMEKPDEAAFLEGLRVFGEVVGRYPNSLNVMNLSQEMIVVSGTLRARQLKAKSEGRPAEDIPNIEVVGKKTQGLMFGAVLETEGRQPRYFGDQVKPGEAKAVLIEWRLEDGRRRVIYGNLRGETLPAASPQGEEGSPNAGGE